MLRDTITKLLELPATERVDIAMALWDSLPPAAREAEFDLAPEQRTELDRRLADHAREERPTSQVTRPHWRSTRLKTLALVALLLLVAVVVLAILRKRHVFTDSSEPWPFYAKRPLTEPEQVLYHRLVKSLPQHIVLAQVQVSRVLGVKKGFNFHQWNNRINRLSYDFVICSKDATVLAAIELDDKTHERASRAQTDDKKDKATSAAGVRLVRWSVKALPDEGSIQEALYSSRAAPRMSTSRQRP